MKTYIIVCILFLIGVETSVAQGWQQYYGGSEADFGYDVIETSDHGFIAVGATNSYSGGCLIVKTDSLGKLVWQKVLGNIAFVNGKYISENSAGDYFVLGETNVGTGNKDIYVAKLNPQGTLIWSQTYGGTQSETASGIVNSVTDLVISGTTNSFGQGQNDIYLFKIDSSGTQLWSKTIGSLVNEVSYGLSKVHDGGFLLCGVYNTPSFNTAYAARTDANGDSIWTKIINIGNDGIVRYVSCTELKGDSTFVMVGEGGSVYGTYYASRLDLNGNVLNHYTQSGYLRYATDVAPTFDGGFIVEGYPLMKFDYKATSQWEANVPGNSIIQSSDSSYVIVGTDYGFGYPLNQDLMLKKTNSIGVVYQQFGYDIIVTPPSPHCPGDQVTINVPGTFDHYQWLQYINNYTTISLLGTDNDSILVDSSGTYYCIMQLGTEIIRSEQGYVAYGPVIPHQLNYSDTVSFCAADTSISISINGVTGGTYQWYVNGSQIPGAISSIYTPTTSGNYNVSTSTVSCGTVFSDTLNVNVNAIPILEITAPTKNLSMCLNNGLICDSALISVVPHVGFSYQWHLNGNQVGTNQSYHYAKIPGAYSVVVTNSCGTTTSAIVGVVADTIDLAIIVNGPLTGCGSANTQLSVPINSNYFYLWYKNGFPINNWSFSLNPNSSGDYFCKISFQCAGSLIAIFTDTITYNYIQHVGSSVNFQRIAPTICANDSILLNISFVSNVTYQWFVDSVAIPGADTSIYYAKNTGNYYCETYFPGCTPVKNGPRFIRKGFPEASISAIETQICIQGNRDLKLNTVDYINGTYGTAQWSKDGIAISGASGSNISVNQPGIYDCTVANLCGAVLTNAITMTSSIDSVDLTLSIPGQYFCKGDSVTINATYFPGYTYSWYRNGILIPGADSTFITTTQSGNYSLKFNNSICDIIKYITITQTGAYKPNILTSSLPQFCGNGSVLLTANEGPNLSYQWYIDNSLIPGANQISYNAQVGGEYSVVIFDSLGCDYISPIKHIYENDIGSFSIYTSTATNVVCNNDSIDLYAGFAGVSYQWFYNTDTIVGATGYSVKAFNPGLYSISVTDANGCSGRVSIMIYQQSTFGLASTISPDLCNDSVGMINIANSGNLIFLWSNGATINPLMNIPAGNYTVTVTSLLGCIQTQSFVVPDQDSVTATITGNTSICIGQNSNLNAGNGYSSYLWSTGATTQTVQITTGGIYTVTVTNVSGCSGSDSVLVTVNPLPVINLTSVGPPSFCAGDSALLTVGQGLHNFQWYHNSVLMAFTTDSIYYVKSRGVYSCWAVNSNNCTNFSNNLTVTVPCIQTFDPVEKMGVKPDLEFVKIFPNPTSGYFNISLNKASDSPVQISVFDFTGRKSNATVERLDNTSFKLTIVEPGIYLVQVKNNQFVETIRVVKTN